MQWHNYNAAILAEIKKTKHIKYENNKKKITSYENNSNNNEKNKNEKQKN